MTNSYQRHNSFIYVRWPMTHLCTWHDSFTYVTWLRTHWYTWHDSSLIQTEDSCIYVTWLMSHTGDMESFVFVTWLGTRSYTWHDSCLIHVTCIRAHSFQWHDPGLIHILDMTNDSYISATWRLTHEYICKQLHLQHLPVNTTRGGGGWGGIMCIYSYVYAENHACIYRNIHIYRSTPIPQI